MLKSNPLLSSKAAEQPEVAETAAT